MKDMTLVRHFGLSESVKRLVDGPRPGGTFWAWAEAHDLGHIATPLGYAQLSYMLRHGEIWVGEAGFNPHWQKLSRADEIQFERFFDENYERCSVNVDAVPFMPQFYFVPRDFRGIRLVRRAEARAWKRMCEQEIKLKIKFKPWQA